LGARLTGSVAAARRARRASFEQQLAEARARVPRRRASVPEVSYPPQLPISARRDDLLAAIQDHQVVVAARETGSGKTTQLPRLCLELAQVTASLLDLRATNTQRAIGDGGVRSRR
jgi:ATP-dependent helicase HrpA